MVYFPKSIIRVKIYTVFAHGSVANARRISATMSV